jgi:hypothetical protein
LEAIVMENPLPRMRRFDEEALESLCTLLWQVTL